MRALRPAIGFVALLCLSVPSAPAQEATVLTGRVTDRAGNPLGGVSIGVPASESSRTTTDPKGRFRFRLPTDPSEGPEVLIRHPGFVEETLRPPFEPGPLEVVLVRSASLRVLVVDHTGRPVPGVAVEVGPHTENSEARRHRLLHVWEEPLFRGETDSDGRVRLSGLPPGRYSLRAVGDGLLSSSLLAANLDPGEIQDLRIDVEPSYRLVLHGRVVDPYGDPVVGAEVGLMAPTRTVPLGHRLVPPHATTDSGGSYQLVLADDLPDWAYDGSRPDGLARFLPANLGPLVAFGEGYAPSFVPVVVEALSGSRRVDLTLAEGGTVSGQVLDEAGEPVPGLRLALQMLIHPQDDPHAPERPWLVAEPRVFSRPGERAGPIVTDEQGRFRITRLPTGELRIRTGGEGHQQLEAVTVSVVNGEESSGWTVPHRWGRIVAGRVSDAGGAPLEEVKVLLRTGWRQRNSHARTGADGTFRISGLGAGIEFVALEARKGGFGPSTLKPLPEDPTRIEITLIPGGRLAGSVYDAATGEPVANYRVNLRPHRLAEEELGVRLSKEITSTEGFFEIDDIAPGLYTVTILSDAHLPEIRNKVEILSLQAKGLPPVHLEPGLELRGQVLHYSTGEPLQGVAVRTNPKPRREAVTDEEGRFRLRGLPPEALELHASYPGMAQFRRTVSLQEGEEIEPLEIRLGPGASLQVRLVNQEGDPLPDREVAYRRLDLDPSRAHGLLRKRTDPAGTVRWDRLAPGRYQVQRGRVHPQRPPFQLDHGEDCTITLRESETRILVSLTYGGRPVEEASVRLNMEGERRILAADEREGRWVFDSIPPGDYVLGAHARHPDDPPEGLKSLRLRRHLRVARSDPDRQLDLAFPIRSIRGRVLHQGTGEPVAGVGLHLTAPPPWGGFSAMAGHTKSREDGSFEFLGLKPGRYYLNIHDPFREPRIALYGPPSITVPEKDHPGPVDVMVGPEREGEGRVLTASGVPVERGLVRIGSADFAARRGGIGLSSLGYFIASRTDMEGKFQMSSSPAGSSVVGVDHPDYARTWMVVDPGSASTEPSLVFRLEKGGDLEIRLDEELLLGGQYRLELQSGEVPFPILHDSKSWVLRQSGAPTPQGGLLFDRLPSGTWTVDLKTAKGDRRAVTEVRQGERSVVDLATPETAR